MSELSEYLAHAVTIRRARAPDAYGDPQYSDPEQHPARYVKAAGRTVNNLGVEVPNRDTILLEAEVSVGDLVESVARNGATEEIGATVEGVEEIVDEDGILHGHKVSM